MFLGVLASRLFILAHDVIIMVLMVINIIYAVVFLSLILPWTMSLFLFYSNTFYVLIIAVNIIMINRYHRGFYLSYYCPYCYYCRSCGYFSRHAICSLVCLCLVIFDQFFFTALSGSQWVVCSSRLWFFLVVRSW